MRSVKPLLPRLIVLATLFAATGACSDDPAAPERGFEVTGTVSNRSGIEVPSDARILVVWGVSASSPDYNYVFGEGDLVDEGTAFRVEIDEPPPEAALNLGAVGVGVIIVTTDQTIGMGDDVESISEEAILGAAGQFGVIYVAPESDAGETLPWVEAFSEGYNVGRGVDVEGDFDEFTAVGADEVEIILDDLDAIEFVNWT